MGFESSEVARRRLAALASSNVRVQEAVAPSTFPGLACPAPSDLTAWAEGGALGHGSAGGRPAGLPAALARQLDTLAQEIVATPGAGGALLAAFAAQARALSLVLEAARRAGTGPLPAAVLRAAQEALDTPSPLADYAIG